MLAEWFFGSLIAIVVIVIAIWSFGVTLRVPNRDDYRVDSRRFTTQDLYACLRARSSDPKALYFLHPAIDFAVGSLVIYLVDKSGVIKVRTFESVDSNSFVFRSTSTGWETFSEAMSHTMGTLVYEFVDPIELTMRTTRSLADLSRFARLIPKLESDGSLSYVDEETGESLNIHPPKYVNVSLNVENQRIVELSAATPCAIENGSGSIVTYRNYLKFYRKVPYIDNNVPDVIINDLRWYCENERDVNPRLVLSDNTIDRYRRRRHVNNSTSIRDNYDSLPMYIE